MSVSGPLTELEIATGMLLGGGPPIDLRRGHGSVRSVLDELLRPALETGRCVVAFSGGRDSSVLLAAATDLARREGHALPLPLTYRYAAHPRTVESDWQELVVEHLGLPEWERFEVADEVDALGPAARALLADIGLYWPANAHTMTPLLERATGGALVTGNGGDEVLSWRRVTYRESLSSLRRSRDRRDLHSAAMGLLPEPLRWLLLRAAPPVGMSWLTAKGSRQLARTLAGAWAPRTRDWEHLLANWLSRRYLAVAHQAFDSMARRAGAQLVEPFSSSELASALVRTAPPGGFAGRTGALRAHFSDLLPDAVLSRTSKAVFTEVIWGPEARSFARSWDGSGLDESLVVPERLRAVWQRDRPDMRSVTALHAAWLRTRTAVSP